MKRLQDKTFMVSSSLLLFLAAMAQASFVPWDGLSSDNWMSGASNPANIYTVNGSTYTLGFGTTSPGAAAKGINAVQFSDGVNNTGRLKSTNLTGVFDIDNTGGKNWTHVLLLVAIDADTLGQDFSFSLSTDGGFSYNFNPSTDFCVYNNPLYDTGRPSGYYSGTNPTSESVAYDFSTGMVTVFELPNIAIASGASLTIDYAFENLPGRAVFSAYAEQGNSSTITHTNRAVTDLNDPTATVSTFEVVPEPMTLLLMTTGALILRRKR